MTDELRIYVIWRTDIDIPYAKAIVQGGHACSFLLNQVLKTDPTLYARYCDSDAQAKIVLNGKSVNAILEIEGELRTATIPHFVVTDFGRTVFPEPTITCMSVGPITRNQMPSRMKRLQLLR